MSRLSTISWGAERFRVGPWHVDGRVAYIAGSAENFHQMPSPSAVAGVLDRLRKEGYARVVTSAMRPQEIPAFLAAGFEERERLIVLERPIRRNERAPAAEIRRCRRADMDEVLRVDHAAFTRPWQLDGMGIREALHATPHSRLRIAGKNDEVRGYAVCGRAGRTGYLQRLAVDPPWQSRGIGRALIADAVAWLSRRWVAGILVNTQETNRRAVDVYLSLGFRPSPSRLIVLEREL